MTFDDLIIDKHTDGYEETKTQSTDNYKICEIDINSEPCLAALKADSFYSALTINFYADHVNIKSCTQDFLHAWINEHKNVLFVDMKDVDGCAERGLQINLSIVKRALRRAGADSKKTIELTVRY